ncbi:hypothetical protein WJX73_004116 [Symbiochloris irregularis]|uniref:RRM domain-containing protein n=1 Tax=Symbiochloris irregularis TaxID=706552 RepID=A0AAW1NTH8_9CHLO
MGKLQSPFYGRYETVDPDHPILYPRWHVTSKGDIQADSDDTAADSRKRRREEKAEAKMLDQQGEAQDQDAGTAQNGHDSPRKEKKSKNAKRPAEEPAEQPLAASSGPGNAEEAQQMRQQLGYNDPPTPVQPASFAFGFSVSKDAAAAAAPLSNGTATIAPAEPTEKRQKKQKDQPSKDQQIPNTSGQQANGATPPQEPQEQSSAGGQGVPRRVFVGGMPFSMEEDDVRQFWEECGPIESLDLMRFPDTQRFRGIAFITFCEEEGYQAALQCTGEQVQNQFLRVEPCQSAGTKKSAGSAQPSAPQPVKAMQSQAAPKTAGYNVAYVGNLPFDASVQQLKEAFHGCSVTRVRLHTDRHSGQSKGFAHVHFADEASLDRAIGLDGQDLQGRKMKIGYAQPKK